MGLSNIPTRQLTGNKRGRFLKKLWGWVGYFTDIKGKEVIFNLHFIIFFWEWLITWNNYFLYPKLVVIVNKYPLEWKIHKSKDIFRKCNTQQRDQKIYQNFTSIQFQNVMQILQHESLIF